MSNSNYTGRFPRTAAEAFKDADYANPFPSGDPWFMKRATLADKLFVTASVITVILIAIALLGEW